MKPHTFCHFCGVAHTSEGWPRKCAACSQTTYRNPLPVIVTMIPLPRRVIERGLAHTEMDLLVVRRSIDPHIGGLALPGGYVDFGETWQEAASRELWEETGYSIPADTFKLHVIKTATNGSLLIFCICPPVSFAEILKTFKPNHEVSELAEADSSTNLCFETHNAILQEFVRD